MLHEKVCAWTTTKHIRISSFLMSVKPLAGWEFLPTLFGFGVCMAAVRLFCASARGS
jgi:hypothetical protein